MPFQQQLYPCKVRIPQKYHTRHSRPRYKHRSWGTSSNNPNNRLAQCHRSERYHRLWVPCHPFCRHPCCRHPCCCHRHTPTLESAFSSFPRCLPRHTPQSWQRYTKHTWNHPRTSWHRKCLDRFHRTRCSWTDLIFQILHGGNQNHRHSMPRARKEKRRRL